jgi:hypothetical protein
MKRRLFAILSAVSLLLCVATCGLWAWSYRDPMGYEVDASFVGWKMRSSDGWLALTGPAQLRSQAERRQRAEADRRTAIIRFAETNEPYRSALAAWREAGSPDDGPVYQELLRLHAIRSRARSATFLTINGVRPHFDHEPYSHAKLAAATAALPAAWASTLLFGRLRRGRNASPAGLCPACGYDLRATPGRCPECGAV